MAPAIEVRDACPDDAGTVVELWAQMSVGAGQQRLLTAPTAASARVSIARLADDPGGRLVVGELDGRLSGMVYLRRTPISPLHDEVTVTIEYLHVTDDARRHGLGKALVAEATAWAEQSNCPHLGVVAPAAAREANRFLARLGLGQAAVLRIASTHTVRRRLAADHAPNLLALLSSRRSVIARRAQLGRGRPNGDQLLAETPAHADRFSFPAEPESAGR